MRYLSKFTIAIVTLCAIVVVGSVVGEHSLMSPHAADAATCYAGGMYPGNFCVDHEGASSADTVITDIIDASVNLSAPYFNAAGDCSLLQYVWPDAYTPPLVYGSQSPAGRNWYQVGYEVDPVATQGSCTTGHAIKYFAATSVASTYVTCDSGAQILYYVPAGTVGPVSTGCSKPITVSEGTGCDARIIATKTQTIYGKGMINMDICGVPIMHVADNGALDVSGNFAGFFEPGWYQEFISSGSTNFYYNGLANGYNYPQWSGYAEGWVYWFNHATNLYEALPDFGLTCDGTQPVVPYRVGAEIGWSNGDPASIRGGTDQSNSWAHCPGYF